MRIGTQIAYEIDYHLQSIVISVCVCVCLSASTSKTRYPNFTKFSVHVAFGCGSIPFSEELQYFVYFRFVVNVMFAHNAIHRRCEKGKCSKQCTRAAPGAKSDVYICLVSAANYYYTHLTAVCLGLPRWTGTRKVKPIWIYWSKR